MFLWASGRTPRRERRSWSSRPEPRGQAGGAVDRQARTGSGPSGGHRVDLHRGHFLRTREEAAVAGPRRRERRAPRRRRGVQPLFARGGQRQAEDWPVSQTAIPARGAWGSAPQRTSAAGSVSSGPPQRTPPLPRNDTRGGRISPIRREFVSVSRDVRQPEIAARVAERKLRVVRPEVEDRGIKSWTCTSSFATFAPISSVSRAQSRPSPPAAGGEAARMVAAPLGGCPVGVRRLGGEDDQGVVSIPRLVPDQARDRLIDVLRQGIWVAMSPWASQLPDAPTSMSSMNRTPRSAMRRATRHCQPKPEVFPRSRP